jgi:hypothetical protein
MNSRSEIGRLLIAGGSFNLSTYWNGIGTGATSSSGFVNNLTIIDALIDIQLTEPGVGIGSIGTPSEQERGACIGSLTIIRTRINVTALQGGVCIGAMMTPLAQGANGRVSLGDMTIEETQVFCNGLSSNSTGVGSGLAIAPTSVSTGLIRLSGTTIVCDGGDGPCLGNHPIGNGSSRVGTVIVEDVRIRSESLFAINVRDSEVRLAKVDIECKNFGSSCISSDGLIVETSLLGRTRTLKYFEVERLELGQDLRMVIKYLNKSESEGITGTKLLHLIELKYLDEGPYVLYLEGVGESSEVDMSGEEAGVLMSLPTWVFGGLCHRGRRETVVYEGHVGHSNGSFISFGSGETMIRNPVFVIGTASFTSSFTPYQINKVIFSLVLFVMMIRL